MQRSIDYYESAMSQPPVNGCMVATTHGWQDRICDYLSEMMPVPIRPVRAELRTLFDLCLFNPDAEKVDWDDVTSISETPSPPRCRRLVGCCGAFRRERRHWPLAGEAAA